MPTVVLRCGAVYLHLERTGGTSLSRALLDLGVAFRLDPARDHVPGHALDAHSRQGRDLIATVRSPWRWYPSFLAHLRRTSDGGGRLAPYEAAAEARDGVLTDAGIIRSMVDPVGRGVQPGTYAGGAWPPPETLAGDGIPLCSFAYAHAYLQEDRLALPPDRWGPHGEALVATLAVDTDALADHAVEVLREAGEDLSDQEVRILSGRLAGRRELASGATCLPFYDDPSLAELVAERDGALCAAHGYGWDPVAGPTGPRVPWRRWRTRYGAEHLPRQALTVAERTAEERARWSAKDQYGGDLQARRARHEAFWGSLFPLLDLGRLPPGPVCVVGCGLGGAEYQACRDLPDRAVDAVDLATPEGEPPAWADSLGRFGPRLRYYPGTDVCNGLPGRYALVVCTAVLHHVADPDAAVAALHRALLPGGRLLVAEYVGGDGLVADPLRARVADRLWCALPDAMRTRANGDVQRLPRRVIPGEASGMEAYRSSRLLPALLARFRVIRRCDHGRPLTGYRLVCWGEHGLQRERAPALARLLDAVEDLVVGEGWLAPEDLYAALEPLGEADDG